MNTTSRRKIAITAIGTAMAGALCLGTATPAFAHDGAKDPSHNTRVSSAQFTPPTLDQQKARATAKVDHWLLKLQKKAAKVAASDRLTADQKATFAAKAASAALVLTNLKTAIAAATTSADLKVALHAGWAGIEHLLHKHDHLGQHHHVITVHSLKGHEGRR